MSAKGTAQLNDALQEEVTRLKARIARLEGLRFCGLWSGTDPRLALFNDDRGPTETSFSLIPQDTIGRALARLDEQWELAKRKGA